MKYPLGWCLGKRHCNECPGVWYSTLEKGAVDYCICDCHEEKK
jgi:hypothetical protein